MLPICLDAEACDSRGPDLASPGAVRVAVYDCRCSAWCPIWETQAIWAQCGVFQCGLQNASADGPDSLTCVGEGPEDLCEQSCVQPWASLLGAGSQRQRPRSQDFRVLRLSCDSI